MPRLRTALRALGTAATVAVVAFAATALLAGLVALIAGAASLGWHEFKPDSGGWNAYPVTYYWGQP